MDKGEEPGSHDEVEANRPDEMDQKQNPNMKIELFRIQHRPCHDEDSQATQNYSFPTF
jgi:hypothetical protein